jgi:hypothetical protein
VQVPTGVQLRPLDPRRPVSRAFARLVASSSTAMIAAPAAVGVGAAIVIGSPVAAAIGDDCFGRSARIVGVAHRFFGLMGRMTSSRTGEIGAR